VWPDFLDERKPRNTIFIKDHLLRGSVLGDSLGSFRNGVLGQFTGKQKPDGSLDFPRSDGTSLVVMGEARSFGGDALKNIVDEGVHDRHGFR